MRKAIFTGTFDPPTLGHLNIIKRGALLFDTLIVAVYCTNLKRKGLEIEDKLEILKEMTSEISNVEVVSFSGLAVDSALKFGAKFILRGIRNHSDFDYESQMAETNKLLSDLETVFLLADPAFAHLSSTLIREIAASGRRLNGLVPNSIEELTFRKLQTRV